MTAPRKASKLSATGHHRSESIEAPVTGWPVTVVAAGTFQAKPSDPVGPSVTNETAPGPGFLRENRAEDYCPVLHHRSWCRNRCLGWLPHCPCPHKGAVDSSHLVCFRELLLCPRLPMYRMSPREKRAGWGQRGLRALSSLAIAGVAGWYLASVVLVEEMHMEAAVSAKAKQAIVALTGTVGGRQSRRPQAAAIIC
jgi:hypothetical protein